MARKTRSNRELSSSSSMAPGSSVQPSERQTSSPQTPMRSPLESMRAHPVGATVVLTTAILVSLTALGFHISREGNVLSVKEVEQGYVSRETHRDELAVLQKRIASLEEEIQRSADRNKDLSQQHRMEVATLTSQVSRSNQLAQSCRRLRQDLNEEQSAQQAIEKIIRSGGDSTLVFQRDKSAQELVNEERELADLRRRSEQIQQRIIRLQDSLSRCVEPPS